MIVQQRVLTVKVRKGIDFFGNIDKQVYLDRQRNWASSGRLNKNGVKTGRVLGVGRGFY